MDDTPEVIRQQMEETKSQLSEKMESLEHHVSETVQTAGNAVKETVEVIQSAVQSVTNAFDIRRQVDRHPWLAFGGAVVLGYLAVDYLSGTEKKSEQLPEAITPPPSYADNPGTGNDTPVVDSTATASALSAAYESGRKSSLSHPLREEAMGALLGIVRVLAVQAVPQVLEYLSSNRNAAPNARPETSGEQNGSAKQHASSEGIRRQHIDSPESLRSGSSH